jgi:asparagine synthase (glutamine-hydrolysing)
VFVGRLAGGRPGAFAQQIVDCHAREGLKALTNLHGDYVAFISDGARAWVVRDRLGAHTLSFAARDRWTALGEHDIDVLELLPATPVPDRMAVVQWIERRTLPEGRSLFAGVSHLQAGRMLELSAHGTTVRTYWQPKYGEVDKGTRTELATALREEAFAAVARAREGARNPGLRLSGGLDSACVGAGLARAGGSPAHALAVTFPDDPAADESALIRASAQFSGLQLSAIPFRHADLLGPMLSHLERWRVPPPTPNLVMSEPLAALARELGVDVLLDGEAGDEMFGASKYLVGDFLRAGRLTGAWRLSGSLPGAGEHVPWRLRLWALRAIGVSGALPLQVQAWRRQRRPREHLVSHLVRDHDVDALMAEDDPWRFKRRDGPLWWRHKVASFVDVFDAMDVNGFSRRQATDGGVDQRHPFLHDVGLLERVLRTPPETAFESIRDRPLLRDALAGHIAEEVRTRHAKSHFTGVSVSPLAGAEGQRLATELALSDAPVREYVSDSGLKSLLSPAPSTPAAAAAWSGQLTTVGLINRWLLLLDAPLEWPRPGP